MLAAQLSTNVDKLKICSSVVHQSTAVNRDTAIANTNCQRFILVLSMHAGATALVIVQLSSDAGVLILVKGEQICFCQWPC